MLSLPKLKKHTEHNPSLLDVFMHFALRCLTLYKITVLIYNKKNHIQ